MQRTLRHLVHAMGMLFALAALASDTDLLTQSSKREAFSEFHFVRLAYTDSGARFRGGDAWLTDFPEAEQHLMDGVRRLSRINADPEGVQLAIMDPKLFDYPWIYAVE